MIGKTLRCHEVIELLKLGTAVLAGVVLGGCVVAGAATHATLQQIQIDAGVGSFIVPGGEGHEELTIEVYTYRPQGYGPTSPVLFVMPGAGRNGDDYRDAWIEAAEEHDVLILSPSFAEAQYPEFYNYNLGRMIHDVRRLTGRFETYEDASEWIYGDIDRIFDIVAESVGSDATGYDIFGHSAGGQFVHRLVLFAPDSKVERAVAANSGWYTLPTFSEVFPYGLDTAPADEERLRRALQVQLVLLLGELDNADETRGSLRTTPAANRQGLHRLARGEHAFAMAQSEAQKLGVPLAWRRQIVPGVGHDQAAMGRAAAELLYTGSETRRPNH